jgi:hypothetical protein
MIYLLLLEQKQRRNASRIKVHPYVPHMHSTDTVHSICVSGLLETWQSLKSN